MGIAVGCSAAGAVDVGWVANVEEDEATTAGEVVSHADSLISTNGADSNGVVEFLVDDDVVGATDGEVVPEGNRVTTSRPLA